MGLCSSEERKNHHHYGHTEHARQHYLPEEEGRRNQCVDQQQIRRQVNQVFDKYDLNKDGVLEKQEVRQMIAEMHAQKGREVEREKLQSYVDNFMLRADSEQNGKISHTQFYEFYKQQ